MKFDAQHATEPSAYHCIMVKAQCCGSFCILRSYTHFWTLILVFAPFVGSESCLAQKAIIKQTYMSQSCLRVSRPSYMPGRARPGLKGDHKTAPPTAQRKRYISSATQPRGREDEFFPSPGCNNKDSFLTTWAAHTFMFEAHASTSAPCAW